MTDLTLTASQKFLIGEIWSMPGKIVPRNDLYRSAHNGAHMTPYGFSRVLAKMERNNLIAYDGNSVTITFKGTQAARALGWTDNP